MALVTSAQLLDGLSERLTPFQRRSACRLSVEAELGLPAWALYLLVWVCVLRGELLMVVVALGATRLHHLG
jgi:hypothetical protein